MFLSTLKQGHFTQKQGILASGLLLGWKEIMKMGVHLIKTVSL